MIHSNRMLRFGVLLVLFLISVSVSVDAGITKSGDVITISTDGAGTTGSTLVLAYTLLDVYNADVGGSWNVVHKQGDNQFKVDCSMTIGGPSGTTYFKFIKEDFLFCGETFQVGGGTMPWHYYPGVVHLGEMVDGEPVNGSTFTFGYTGVAAETRLFAKAETLHIYNSQIKTITTVPSKIQITNAGPLVMNRAIIDGVTSPVYEVVSNWQMDVDNSVIQNANIGVYMEDISRRMVFNNLIFKNCNTGIYNYGMGGVTTLLNMETKNTPLLVDVDTSGWTLRLVNPDIETWHVNIRYSSTYVYRIHSFDLKVFDPENVPIPDAVVEIYGLGNNLVVNMTTDVNGLLIESGTAESSTPTSLIDTDMSWTVNTFKGFLIEITAGTGVGQIRGIEGNTANTVKIGSGASNWWKTNPDHTSEYKITPVLEYGYLSFGNGDNFTMQTPHTMKITKTDYSDYNINFSVDQAIDWTIALQPTSTGPVAGGRIAHIYAIMMPVLAFVLMIFSFWYGEYARMRGVSQLGGGGNILPPFLSAFFWFVSAYTSLNIKFIDPSGTNPYYMESGSTDITMFFTALAVIMLLYAIFSVLTIRRNK